MIETNPIKNKARLARLNDRCQLSRAFLRFVELAVHFHILKSPSSRICYYNGALLYDSEQLGSDHNCRYAASILPILPLVLASLLPILSMLLALLLSILPLVQASLCRYCRYRSLHVAELPPFSQVSQ